ncbi:hypothetical protein BGZ96_000327 [Linnemannia gamsii]|uniref:Uncharacterized protein n=1 Tax=Linnemannia gamsii TaxID=64522 RepID=A0ABQ7JPP3_9FUNG|nr:hypothetical protein BGZ96_000327 [Linnemannia gamsii]
MADIYERDYECCLSWDATQFVCVYLARLGGQADILEGVTSFDTQDQDVKDELFVTCDGVTIEIYSDFGDWSHRPLAEFMKGVGNILDPLAKKLRGSYLVLGDSIQGRIATWNIEQETRLSSCTQCYFDRTVVLVVCSALSKDGNLIAVAAENHVDIFWTTTWTLAVSYTIDDTQLYLLVARSNAFGTTPKSWS